jgi:ABC-type Fe3+ transport system permease subunit
MTNLIDRYKETLKEQGVRKSVPAYKIKKDKTTLFLLIVVLAVGLPLYLLIFQNYSSCTVYDNGLLSVEGSIGAPFNLYINCGVNTLMYSIAAALFIAIMVFLILKALKYRRIG